MTRFDRWYICLRTAWTLIVSISLSLGLPSVDLYAQSSDKRPNFILCMGDDHGWDETGYNGHPHLRTPVLDDMAASGLRLDRFYAAAPVCSPTRGSFITGRHPNRYGTFSANWSIRPQEIGMAQLLAQAGYACAHFGKWHLGPVRAESPTNPGALGFETWLSHDNFFELDPYLSRDGGPPQRFEGESSEIIIQETMRFIDSAQQRKQPFLIVVWFGSPHEPYMGLPQDLALYDDLPDRYRQEMVRVTSVETGLPARRPVYEVLRERYAEITAMDRSLGQLRDYLRSEGLRDETLLLYCGDNGVPAEASLTTPLRGQKGLVYEGGLRVPGLIEWPGRISESRTSDVNVVTSDLLPTLCDLAGCSLPQRPLDGISLRGLLDGQLLQRPSPICFWSYHVRSEANRFSDPSIDPALQEGTTPLVKLMDGKSTRSFRNLQHPTITDADYAGPRAILDNRYKLVIDEGAAADVRVELFDVRSDPAESTNLAGQHPDIVARLEQELLQWQHSVLQSLTGADYAR